MNHICHPYPVLIRDVDAVVAYSGRIENILKWLKFHLQIWKLCCRVFGYYLLILSHCNYQITAPLMISLQVLLTIIKKRSDSIHIFFEEKASCWKWCAQPKRFMGDVHLISDVTSYHTRLQAIPWGTICNSWRTALSIIYIARLHWWSPLLCTTVWPKLNGCVDLIGRN